MIQLESTQTPKRTQFDFINLTGPERRREIIAAQHSDRFYVSIQSYLLFKPINKQIITRTYPNMKN